MRIELTKSIGFKMAAAVAVGLFVVIGIFSFINIKTTEKRLMKMAEIESFKISDSIKSSFEHATSEGNEEMIQDIITTVSQQSMVEDIKILSSKGQVKWAKEKSAIGTVIDWSKEKNCMICHSGGAAGKERKPVVFENSGKRILRNMNPILNAERCHRCHDAHERIRGVLLLDFSMDDADSMMADSRKMLIASAIASLLSAILISFWLIRRTVDRPLSGLLDKMEEVERGNFDTVVTVDGEDEISALGNKFNNMVASMKACRTKMIDEHLNERLTLFNIAGILDKSDSVDEASTLILDAINMGFGADECAIMTLKETGRVHLKGSIGLGEEKAEFIKDLVDSAFILSVSSEGEARCFTESGLEISDFKNRLVTGEPFTVKISRQGMTDFLVVPLKASGRLVGAITIHRIRGKEIREIADIEETKKLFQIVSTQVSPYLFIGLCMDEKRTMKVSPFSCFLDLISEHIERVREYNGFVSLAVIKIGNYKELCEKMGVEKASQRVEEAGFIISSAIDSVHDATRITEIKFVLILPMTDKVEALEIINRAVAGIGDDLVIKSKIVSYPDDGEMPIKLMYLAYV